MLTVGRQDGQRQLAVEMMLDKGFGRVTDE